MVTDVSEILDRVVDKQMEQFKKLNIITNVSDEEFREVLKSIYKDIVEDVLSIINGLIGKTIKLVESKNPYPEDIFTDPTQKEWETMKKLFRKRGLSPDKFFGSFGRKVWLNCVFTLKKEFEMVGLYGKKEKKKEE
ncbi:MAG: hypothetical protein DRO01_00050 [Thermoproteota archaeon]|nr:MAG: hypothetical protein DRO01_00050 [Candidatus Korarchaeota archaeon]